MPVLHAPGGIAERVSFITNEITLGAGIVCAANSAATGWFRDSVHDAISQLWMGIQWFGFTCVHGHVVGDSSSLLAFNICVLNGASVASLKFRGAVASFSCPAIPCCHIYVKTRAQHMLALHPIRLEQ